MKKSSLLLSLLAAALAAGLATPASAQTADDLAALSSRERARFVCKYHSVIARARHSSEALAQDIHRLRRQLDAAQNAAPKQAPSCAIVPVEHRQKCPSVPVLRQPVMCAQVLWTEYVRKCDPPEQTDQAEQTAAPETEAAPSPDLLRAKLAQAEDLFNLNSQWLKNAQNACHKQVNAMTPQDAWHYYRATTE